MIRRTTLPPADHFVILPAPIEIIHWDVVLCIDFSLLMGYSHNQNFPIVERT